VIQVNSPNSLSDAQYLVIHVITADETQFHGEEATNLHDMFTLLRYNRVM
jgi:hypothetical protein